MKQETIISIEKELSDLFSKIKNTKASFNNASVLNVFRDKNINNDECKLLAKYAYQLEKLILMRVILEAGHERIANDFNKSASFPKHYNSIIEENSDYIQSNCKLFGKDIDTIFDEVRDNYHEYLKFLAEDAAGPKIFVNQANSFC